MDETNGQERDEARRPPKAESLGHDERSRDSGAPRTVSGLILPPGVAVCLRMGLKAAVGHSVVRDARAAAREAWDRCRAELSPDFLLILATAGHDPSALVAELHALAPDAAIAGCSAEGVVTWGRADEVDHALGLLAVQSDDVRFTPFLVEGYVKDSVAAARTLAAAVREADRGDSVALILLPDGLGGDCSAFLEALWEGLPRHVRVVGGTAADALRMEQTHQFAGDRAGTKVASGAVAAVLVAGAVHAVTAIGHGCRPIGRLLTVTDADGPWIRAIDGRPAWEVFRGYLDGDPQDLRADGIMHLSVSRELDGQSSVRTPMLLRKDDGALFFPGGGLPIGTRLRLVRRDAQDIRASAVESAAALRAMGRPSLVLQFDCCGRGKQLFGTATVDQLIHPTQEGFEGVPWLGLHTYGEIGPVADAPLFHNYTVSFLALRPA